MQTLEPSNTAYFYHDFTDVTSLKIMDNFIVFVDKNTVTNTSKV